jgi:hypothetical protein
MSEATLTLCDLFEVDTKDLPTRVETALDIQQAALNARQEIKQRSRAIQWSWVRKAVAEESRNLLNLNVIDVLVDAWKKYMQIEQYADPLKYGHGEKILLPLAEHTMKSKHHPSVQILLENHEAGAIQFNLEFSLTLDGFVLMIQDAKLLEIETGSGTGEGSLSLAEVDLWKQELKPVRLPGHILFGDGIPL